MSDREYPPRFELPISSIDKELSLALSQIDMAIEGYIRTRVGDETYDDYMRVRLLDASVEESLSKETTELRRQHRRAAILDRMNQLALQLPDNEGILSDDANSKARAELFFHAQLAEILLDGANIDERENDFINAFSEVTGDLIEEMELLLADRYPELEVTSLDEGRITFCGGGRTIDHSTASEKKLMIIFQANGLDVTTSIVYSYIPLSFTEGEVRREEVDIASLEGEIEYISIDRLKRDTVRALQLVVSGRL